MDKIVAIDPGGTTGVCAIEETASHVEGVPDFQVVMVEEILWENRLTFFEALFYGRLTTINGEPLLPDVVVIESFRLRPGRAMEQIGSNFPSVRVIGIVEAFVALCINEPLLVFQEPSIIGRCEILAEHASMFRGLIHAGDAYRHARYYHLTTRRKP